MAVHDYVEINEQSQLQLVVKKYQLFDEIDQCMRETLAEQAIKRR